MNNNDDDDDDTIKAKRIEHFAASIAAWYDTRMEHDRSLLTLSAAGIGLLVTLMTTVGISSVWSLLLYVGALAAFLVCVVVVLLIFKKNADHIEVVVKHDAGSDPGLRILDIVAIYSFFLGILLSVTIGILTGIESYQSAGVTMTNNTKSTTTTTTTTTTSVLANDSVLGAAKLNPSLPKPLTESFNRASSLAPAPSKPPAAPPVQTQAQQPPTTAPTATPTATKP
jgi:hypothetical protein